MKYDPKNEYKVDIQDSDIQEKIMQAKDMYESFQKQFGNLDVRNEDEVEEAYAFAKSDGLLDAAANIRELIFGTDVTTYGVSYISDTCKSTCTYCPININSTDTETGKPIRRKTLRLEEFVLDTKEIIADGHSHICFLAGDGHLTTSDSEKLIPYLKAANAMEGIDEIILNITPQSVEMFKKYRAAVPDKSLQFRVFQETYNKEVCAQKHANPAKNGAIAPKADFDFRKESQNRALEAGFDNYGLGILLGTNPKILNELNNLVEHANELNDKHGKLPARVCLPTANELVGVNNVEQQHHISAKANELMYALAKLAMPEVSIVSSERDTPEMLATLDKYATNTTVDVQPSVGGNLLQKMMGDRLLQQTTTHPVSPKERQKDMDKRGFNLVFKY